MSRFLKMMRGVLVGIPTATHKATGQADPQGFLQGAQEAKQFGLFLCYCSGGG